MMIRKTQDGVRFPFFTLAVLACLVFLPLFFHSMKYDILDQYLPWRYLVSECLRSGMLPLWNPYTHLGYPMHADPQSGAWYPVVWLISLVTKYNIYWIHFEYIFHAWLGGAGMYLLTRLFTGNRNVSLLAGASYMMSGFFIGNAQHLTWVISAAWIPFVFYYFIKTGLKEGWKDCIRFGLSVFMLLTGGYPAFAIVTAYTLLVLTIIILFMRWRKNENNTLFIGKLSVAFLTILLTGAVMIVSITESFLLAGRAEGLSKSLSMANPFSPQSLLSWVWPLSSLKDAQFFNTDMSMSNGYFGLAMTGGLILGFFRRRSFTEWLILAGTLFFLLCSMGSYTPLRGLLYDFVPLMDLFRMPSLFRLFVIMGCILLGAIALNDIYRSDREKLLKFFRVMVFIYIAVIIVMLAFGDRMGLIPEKYITFPVKISFTSSFIAQGVAGMLALLLMMPVVSKRMAIWLLVPDLLFSAWLCAPVSMVSDVKVKTAYALTQAMPQGFPLPKLTPMASNADRTDTFTPFWCNLGIWKKQPVYDGYNNFQTKQYLEYESSKWFRTVLKNPIIYSTSTDKTAEYPHSPSAIFYDSTFLYADVFPAVRPDTTPFHATVRLMRLTPQYISAESNASTASYLTLQQQYHHAWRAHMKGKDLPIIKTNGNNMTVLVPEGKHRISFTFRDQKIILALQVTAVSLAIFLLILLRLAFIRVRQT